MPKQILTSGCALLSGLALAACGSSAAPGVEQAPSGGATQASVPTTPKPPAALRTKPVVSIGSSASGSTPNDVAVAKSSCSTKQLIKNDLVTGNGQVAQTGQTVTVNYVGVLCSSGKEFDSSWKTGQPASFRLTPGSVITGWVLGIPGMRVGGRRLLIIPPNQAYGKTGRPPTIPPNSALVFVVDLLSVG